MNKAALGIPLALTLLLASCGGGSGGGDSNTPAPIYHTLTLSAQNGTASAEPALEQYQEGSTVVLTATPEEGFEFVKWVGDTGTDWAGDNPLHLVVKKDLNLIARFSTYDQAGTTYYVDFENGDDANDGTTPELAWKHAPGDANYTGTVNLQPGNKVLFKGGVAYRGQIKIPVDGTKNHRIVYQGDAWPGLEGVKAVIDGGNLVTGWAACTIAECGDHPNLAQLHYAYIPAGADPLALNLHEYNATALTDDFLWPSQDPNPPDPFFYDDITNFRIINQANLTLTSLSDPAFFTQQDPLYWSDSYLLIWTNPNTVVTRKIQGYVPAENRVTFDTLNDNALYPDGRDQRYSIHNSPRAIDFPGEYAAIGLDDGRTKVILWPRSTLSLDTRITYSVRAWGIDINERSNVTIEGFKVIKHSRIVIGSATKQHLNKFGLVIQSNTITHNRGDGTGIFLGHPWDSIVQNNDILYNPEMGGIFFGGEGGRLIARGNTIVRSGATSLRLYEIENSILDGNVIRESNGGHANGITLYMGSKNVLVANNRVFDSTNPITMQDSGDLWFINNLIEGGSATEWPKTSRGPWAWGKIVFLNNTLAHGALVIGRYPESNSYISKNNIIHAGGMVDQRSHNIYTAVFAKQEEKDGWFPAVGEQVLLAEDDMDKLFINPTLPGGDYHLEPGTSAAIDGGTDVSLLYPRELFSGFDFTRDLDGKVRTGWDIGAYDY